MTWVIKKSPDKSQISYFLLCNYIDLFIPVAILESDRLFNHAQSHQLAGDKGHTIWPGRISDADADIIYFIILGLWKWVSASDDGKIQKIMQLFNEWMKMQLMNETLRYDVLHNETI